MQCTRYGRPVRPTKEPPRALLSGTLDLEVVMRMMTMAVFHKNDEEDASDDYLHPCHSHSWIHLWCHTLLIAIGISFHTCNFSQNFFSGTCPSYEAESKYNALGLQVDQDLGNINRKNKNLNTFQSFEFSLCWHFFDIFCSSVMLERRFQDHVRWAQSLEVFVIDASTSTRPHYDDGSIDYNNSLCHVSVI